MNWGIDYCVDFYFLGVMFFELFIGELFFIMDDLMELVYCYIVKLLIFENKELRNGVCIL